MREAVFEFQFLTPALLAGADQQSAEMRIPSLRGALRWWTRTLLDADSEEEYFGCVKGQDCRSSSVILRLLRSNKSVLTSQTAQSLTGNKFDYFLWPIQEASRRAVLREGSRFKISCTVKRDRDEIEDRIIKAFLLFGSLGTRSRRAYGSVWPISASFDGEPWHIPTTSEELTAEADTWFSEKGTLIKLSNAKRTYKEAITVCSDLLKHFRCGKSMNGVSASYWGQCDHDLVEKKSGHVFRAALGLPLVQGYRPSEKRPQKTTLSYSVEGIERLASPLLFKVAKLDGGYVPLLLIIRKYVPDDGTEVKLLINKNQVGILSLSHDLLDAISNKKKVQQFAEQAILLSDWE